MEQRSGQRGRGQGPICRSEPLSLFPTFVWRAELEDGARDRIGRAVIDLLARLLPAARDLPPGRSWQSEQGLHRIGELAELVAVIQRMAAAVLEFLRVGHQGVDITGCWANVNAPGAAHLAHQHANNFLSGAYYVEVGEGSDTIQFHDPRPQARVVRPPVRELTAENTDMAVVRVAPGTLLLFPSWLEHSVPANGSAAPRISISWNQMFAGYVETMAPPGFDPGLR